jgi:hypothetical protein
MSDPIDLSKYKKFSIKPKRKGRKKTKWVTLSGEKGKTTTYADPDMPEIQPTEVPNVPQVPNGQESTFKDEFGILRTNKPQTVSSYLNGGIIQHD